MGLKNNTVKGGMVYGVVSKRYHVILGQSPPEVSVVFNCPNVGICLHRHQTESWPRRIPVALLVWGINWILNKCEINGRKLMKVEQKSTYPKYVNDHFCCPIITRVQSHRCGWTLHYGPGWWFQIVSNCLNWVLKIVNFPYNFCFWYTFK